MKRPTAKQEGKHPTIAELRAVTAFDWRAETLRRLARRVWVDRNAIGMPAPERAKIKAAARPEWRAAIAAVRRARDARNASNDQSFMLECRVAQLHIARALIDFGQPFVDRASAQQRQNAEIAALGGQATAEKFARPDLDDLILGCLQRGEKTREYAKEWASHFNVSADTIERHITRVKAQLAKS